MDDCEWTEGDDAAFNLRLVQEYKAAKEMADTAKNPETSSGPDRLLKANFSLGANSVVSNTTSILWPMNLRMMRTLVPTPTGPTGDWSD